MFKGHQLVKLINNNWILDFTDYIGYNVKIDNKGNIKEYKEAFQVNIDKDNITFDKKCRVPLKVLKEASKQIRDYQSSMAGENEYW